MWILTAITPFLGIHPLLNQRKGNEKRFNRWDLDSGTSHSCYAVRTLRREGRKGRGSNRQLLREGTQAGPAFLLLFPLLVAGPRLGDEERRLKHLVPAPAVSLMKSRVKSRPGINSLMSFPIAWSVVYRSFQGTALESSERHGVNPKKSYQKSAMVNTEVIEGSGEKSDKERNKRQGSTFWTAATRK